MDDSYTFKKVKLEETYYIGFIKNKEKYYFNRQYLVSPPVTFSLKKETRWQTSMINNRGIVNPDEWASDVIKIITDENPEKLFIEHNNNIIIQRFILNPHKLKLGVKEWMIAIPLKK
jgi:hypothetical protein